MSEKQLLAFQLHEMLGPVVLFYAGSSSSIVTSQLVVFFCSASGPAGRMLVTVWRSASICSSVSRSSLSSTICRRKKTSRVTNEPPRLGHPMSFPVPAQPLSTELRAGPEPPVSRSSPPWLHRREKLDQISG